MTEPTPDQQGTTRAAKPKVKAGDVVSFTRTDPILRREHRGVGLVAAVDDAGVEVRPLEARTIRVAPDEVAALAADDVSV